MFVAPKNPGPTSSIVDSSEAMKNPGIALLADVRQTNHLALDLNVDMLEPSNLKGGNTISERSRKIPVTNNGTMGGTTPPLFINNTSNWIQIQKQCQVRIQVLPVLYSRPLQEMFHMNHLVAKVNILSISEMN